MHAAGVDWQRMVVAKLENGWRQDVSVAELLALARVLQVSPVHLIVPPDADTYQVTAGTRDTAGTTVPADLARDWIGGRAVLPGDDMRLYLAELPISEAEEIGRAAETARVAFPKR